ncbi:secreted repeat protein with Y-X4-D motif [Paenisporosarcina sp. OV554]|nr:secreted repeat protein with Y-X4-D motif [Paenisporosarcina sp. OV554]
MALYYFTKDEPNTTNCSGECLENWPAFYAENLEAPEGFIKDDFGTITREDTGEKQTTYKGYPLYYFVKDEASGDVNGQGVKDVWFIVNSETTFAQ